MARRTRAVTRHEEFVFHVRAPSLSYHFGIIQPDRKLREWPFDDSESVHFVTECIWPDRLKGREGKATLYPEPAIVDHKLLAEDDVRRKWIGHVRASNGRSKPPSGYRPRSAGG